MLPDVTVVVPFLTLTVPNGPAPINRDTRLFVGVPIVYVAFWPGALMLALTVGPPGVIVPVRSFGTTHRFTASVPVAGPPKSTPTVYWPGAYDSGATSEEKMPICVSLMFRPRASAR